MLSRHLSNNSSGLTKSPMKYTKLRVLLFVILLHNGWSSNSGCIITITVSTSLKLPPQYLYIEQTFSFYYVETALINLEATSCLSPTRTALVTDVFPSLMYTDTRPQIPQQQNTNTLLFNPIQGGWSVLLEDPTTICKSKLNCQFLERKDMV